MLQDHNGGILDTSYCRRLRFEPLEPRDVLDAIPILHSLPGAAKSLYLDFGGYSYSNPYSGSTAAMQEIWQRVTEDYDHSTST